jgi:uncharacterized membrane protein YccC
MFSKLRAFRNGFLQQFQLKPGQPAIAASLQLLLSVLGPLIVGIVVGHPAQSAIPIMGAWMVAIVNVGGVYRQQATAKFVAIISITAMLLLANLVHGIVWLSLLATFLVMFLLGFAGLWGATASAISLTASIMFIVALAKFATFPNLSTVLQQCLLCFGGGVWSIVVALGIWQFNPYKPVTQSVSDCYQALNQLVEAAKGRVAYPDDRRAQFTLFLQAQDNFTQALTTARDRWSAAWTEGARDLAGNQLLILIEDTPTLANFAVTLVEQVVVVSDHALFQSLQPAIQQSLEQLAAVLKQMSAAIAKGRSSVHLGDLDRAIEALKHQQQILHTQFHSHPVTTLPDHQTALTSLDKISTLLTRLSDQLYTDVELITALEQETVHRRVGSARTRSVRLSFPKLSNLSAILIPLRDHLTVHSIFFRHALRLAIVATIAEVLAARFQIPQGYWVTLTAVIALKPNYGGTSQMILQRVIGTVIGGVIGIAIVSLIHNSWVISICLLLLIMSAMAVQPLSIILFITLLTPAIILLLNATSQGGWEIGVLRIVDSLAGGFLALLGSFLLFPQWERQQLPVQLATTIRANVTYFQQVIAAYLHPDMVGSAKSIALPRRQAALENTNLAASAQRLFSEPRNVQGDVESITTLIFYIRRFFNSVTALADHRQELSEKYQCPEFKQFADTIVQILENGADALQQQQTLQSLPDLDRALEGIHNHLNQLQTAHTSVEIGSRTSTQILRAVRERTPVSVGLDQIAYEIKNIHHAIAQL